MHLFIREGWKVREEMWHSPVQGVIWSAIINTYEGIAYKDGLAYSQSYGGVRYSF